MKRQVPRLNHINLPARDQEGLAKWYAERFGFELRGPFLVGPGTLIVFEPGEPLGWPGNAHFGLRVDSREEVEAWATEFGATVESESTYSGFKALDPEGNRFEIYWEVGE